MRVWTLFWPMSSPSRAKIPTKSTMEFTLLSRTVRTSSEPKEVNRRMKDKAAHACHALCRARVLEEIQRRKGTVSAEHLKLVLSVIDGPYFTAKSR